MEIIMRPVLKHKLHRVVRFLKKTVAIIPHKNRGKSKSSSNLFSETAQDGMEIAVQPPTRPNEKMEWDVFLCHASEDKDQIVRPLAALLEARGLKVWYDEFFATDDWKEAINRGIESSRFGLVVLSPASIAKQWPLYEFELIKMKERQRHDWQKLLVPVLHNLSSNDLLRHSSMFGEHLLNRLPLSTSQGIPGLADAIAQILGRQSHLGTDAPSAFPSAIETPIRKPTNFLPQEVGGLLISPDNRRFAYIAAREGRLVLIADENEHKYRFDQYIDHTLTFSPNSRRIAYAAFIGEEACVIVDDKIYKDSYSEIPNESITFSDDSRRFAFTAISHNRTFVVVDGDI
jgi:hypothetical protein